MYAVDPAPLGDHLRHRRGGAVQRRIARRVERDAAGAAPEAVQVLQAQPAGLQDEGVLDHAHPPESCIYNLRRLFSTLRPGPEEAACAAARSEEHTSELQSLMLISYAVFCLKKKNKLRQTKKHD